MRVALDTNVLAYAEGTNGLERKEGALELIQRLPPGSIVLPVHALGELFNVLVLKAKRPAANARAAILSWRDAYPVIDTSSGVMPVDPIRTLDAIHLATAELLGEPPQLVTIITRDHRVRDNARALGYAVA
jgi:predicted nucleic acid-binding protein